MLQQESMVRIADNSGAKRALQLAAAKLPVKCKIVERAHAEGSAPAAAAAAEGGAS